MAVIRVIKNKNYTTISNIHLKDMNLSLKAKGLLTVMLSLPDDWDYSVAGLIKICKENKKAIQNTLSELEEYGYLTRERINDRFGRFDYEYTVYEIPLDVHEVQSDKSCTDKPQTQKGCTVKEPQLNTKELNTKELNTNKKKDASSSKEDSASKEKVDYEAIKNLFNSICKSYPKVIKISTGRKKHIRARLDSFTVDDFKEAFIKMENSEFMKGNVTKWKAYFDWIIASDENMVKTLEGNYDNNKNKTNSQCNWNGYNEVNANILDNIF